MPVRRLARDAGRVASEGGAEQEVGHLPVMAHFEAAYDWQSSGP